MEARLLFSKEGAHVAAGVQGADLSHRNTKAISPCSPCTKSTAWCALLVCFTTTGMQAAALRPFPYSQPSAAPSNHLAHSGFPSSQPYAIAQTLQLVSPQGPFEHIPASGVRW